MITISIAGDTPAAIGKQASELAALLNGSAKPAAAPAVAPAPKPAATPAPKPAAAPKSAPKPAATPAPAPAAEGEITLNSLRDLGRACIKAGKNAEMKAALAELGADSLTTMDPSKYADADAALRAIVTPAAAEGEDSL